MRKERKRIGQTAGLGSNPGSVRQSEREKENREDGRSWV
jgi:hypothetical protein